MPTIRIRTSKIIVGELVGKAVILTNGRARTVDEVWLDELQGLCMSIEGHDGEWPVSTIKFAQKA